VIPAEQLKSFAHWSRDLKDDELERARKGIVTRAFAKGAYVFHVGDRFEYWTGVISGLATIGLVSSKGKATSLIGVPPGGWFGEGTVLKDEPRRYDVVALRETQIALMNRSTFLWLNENSVAFNRFLVRQLNERLAHFIALAEYHRLLDATGRLARNIAWLFNPVLYPRLGLQIEITQEEVGKLSGLSRQVANKSLKILEGKGLLRVEHSGMTVLDLEKLSRYGE
jgi:CRP/FNR family transcriptional regulator, cyclic AMP receptor protein